MKPLRPLSFLTIGFLLAITCYGQVESVYSDDFETQHTKALELSRLGLFAESIEAMTEAIRIARENDLEEEAIMSQIDLAELMRKTQNFESGLTMLQNIQGSEKYPLQHVRLLDRSVSLIFEGHFYSDEKRGETIQSLLDSAITLAERNGFKSQEALLKNQKGYSLDKEKYAKEAISYMVEAADIFLTQSDTLNYIGAMTKALVIYGNNLNDTVKADSIITILLNELEGREWYVGEAELYGFISDYTLKFNNDSVAHYKWYAEKYKSRLKLSNQISSKEMDNFRVQQETLRFQQEANSTALALKLEESRSRTLFIILAVLALAIISIGFLFYRERLLKREMRNINDQLKVANDKYQMLMVESNHRIKNNLQMVISMLEFASRDVDPSNKKALKRISGKIHTVSLLHKHLYADVHNENVSLKVFFNEIIQANKEMSLGSLDVKESFDEVNIRSERIIYFGLILNEMLANTIEHCKDEIKKVNLAVSRNGIGYHFNYEDNSHWGMDYKKGTGSLLIEQLVRRIGGKEYQFNPSSGEFKFKFDVES